MEGNIPTGQDLICPIDEILSSQSLCITPAVKCFADTHDAYKLLSLQPAVYYLLDSVISNRNW